MLDAKEVIAEAEKEVREERMEKAKGRIKGKILAVENAKVILANAKRELEDELAAIGDGN